MISVIVPVYNAEKYLRDCIESILAQTYTDFELLLINDGSTDKTGEICDDYSHKPSIRVLHKENGGVSSARNLGLDEAKGEWICFVDADDTIPADALETYVNAIFDDTDLVMSKYQTKDEEGTLIVDYKKYTDRVFAQQEFLQEMYEMKKQEYQGFIWNKCFRRSLIMEHHLRFNESIYFNEDRLFVVQFVCASNKHVVYKDHLTYNYVERSTSAFQSIKRKYNAKFVTDFDANVLMKEAIDRLPFAHELRPLALWGISHSFEWNVNLMIQHGVYDFRNHLHMLWAMLKCGALLQLVKDKHRPFVSLLVPFVYSIRRKATLLRKL